MDCYVCIEPYNTIDRVKQLLSRSVHHPLCVDPGDKIIILQPLTTIIYDMNVIPLQHLVSWMDRIVSSF
jgi:hypothetical protein